MKRVLVLLLMVGLCLPLFAGGQSEGTASEKPQEIRVLLANHPYGELLKQVIPEFEKETGIKVNVESLQESQLTQKLTTEFATNSSTVDVFMTRPLQEGLLFIKNGWYEPLDTYDFSDYPSNSVDIGRKNGHVYIIPLVTEWQVMYYRKDLFKAAGIEVPTNFTELEAAAKALTTDEVAGIGSRGKGGSAVTQLSSYLYNFGGLYLDNNVAVFDTPEAIEAFRYYGRLLGTYGPQGVTSMSWENLMPVFQAGKLAMWTDASVFYGQVVDPTKTQVPAEDVGIAKLPEGPRGDSPFIVVSWGMSISSKTKNPEAAMKFLDWATSKELAIQGMLSNITMARNSAWQNSEVREKMNPGLIETQAHAAQNGYPYDRPFMSSVGKARDLIGEVIIESIDTKGTSPKLEALAAEKTEAVNELLKADGEYGGN
ncbi:ABC transporter substrate-binding protein [Sediminispirochaeta smaragdinae]|jgi:multiple sugar transport system substrate-binding protein|uniref:Extracellular solute-binding protein family 1 n=1 Tax=Sediminispirochaeta smaragdinae (strain DSM 11293 / JCM 15392 / SEBR 4228) TaxID=573413 RepID=E1R7I2_SEDSS|nr:sugar ABC transporter substrate-binding protein [Sediminispirochaeta smaragdinae]ADK82687.1 extracellular solute-binding protein family 1 [Sediminispirochaeta smaragdinae DSM 11293]